jgi:hypothetical protein
MVAALGAELLARDVAPSPAGFPADSSMPLTSVVAAQVDGAGQDG